MAFGADVLLVGRAELPAALRAELAAARPFECEVYDKPDVQVVDVKGAVRASVYLDDRYFVVGDYLSAWSARQMGKPYCCYALTRGAVAAIKGLAARP